MALTRKFLSALGIEADKVEEIITAHSESITALKGQIDELQEKAKAGEEVAELKKQLEQAKTTETKLSELQAEYDKYKADVTGKEVLSAKKSAYKAIAGKAGIPGKWVERVMRGVDFDKIEIDENKAIKNEKEITKSLKDEWADIIPTEQKVGANIATPPAKSGSGTTMTKQQILSIKDGAARRQAIADNAELFPQLGGATSEG